jgi:hypothetical protein
VKTLLALGAGGVSLSWWKAFAADDGRILAATAGLADKASLEVFRVLSNVITLQDDLDPDATKRMYEVFSAEPWGPEHMLRVYNKIRAALGDKMRPAMKDKSWQFDEGEKWFAGHVLTTWYLGIYYHNERPTQRVTYEHALMFRSLRGIIPIPLFENTPFGEWANPPKMEHE